VHIELKSVRGPWQDAMLILSRRPGDAILIDGGIRIVVLASDRRGVRLGIQAPPMIGIVREEIAGTRKNAAEETPAAPNEQPEEVKKIRPA
jgi:carbon storage regulator